MTRTAGSGGGVRSASTGPAETRAHGTLPLATRARGSPPRETPRRPPEPGGLRRSRAGRGLTASSERAPTGTRDGGGSLGAVDERQALGKEDRCPPERPDTFVSA